MADMKELCSVVTELCPVPTFLQGKTNRQSNGWPNEYMYMFMEQLRLEWTKDSPSKKRKKCGDDSDDEEGGGEEEKE